MDDFLDDFTGLVGFSLLPESYESSDNFLTIHMRMMRTKNQTKFQYISVHYGHVPVTLRVPLWILQLVDLHGLVAIYS